MDMKRAVQCPECGTLTPTDLIHGRHEGICRGCLVAIATGDSGTVAAGPSSARRGPPLPAEAAQADPSTRLGKFIPTAKLGSGASGEVWKAWDTVLGRWVALKVFHGVDSEEIARFTREAETAAILSHPNIAAIYEAGDDKGRHFLAMQFVDGVTLQKYPRRDRKTLVRIVRDAARAVAAAHAQGIVHRDLKPANISVARRGENPSQPHVYVLDFGLARRIEGGDKLTASGIVVGSPAYMPPEQARGELVDDRADVYALGATLYELLTKRPPFRGPNVYEVLRKVQEQEPRSPRAYDSAIPRDLELVVLKALEKAPERRYASAAEMADDLDRYLEGDPVLARRPSILYRLRMKLAKRKAVAAAVVSFVLAAALGWWLLVGSADARFHQLMAAGMKLWDEARLAVTGGDPEDIRKKAKAAREGFDLAIQARDESGAQLMRGRCLQLERKDSEALKALERAYELNPGNAEARVELAKAILLKYHASRGLAPMSTPERSVRSEFRSRVGDLRSETAEERTWRERGEKLMAEGKVPPAHESLLKGLLSVGKAEYAPAAAALALYVREERWDAQALMLEGICRYHAMDLEGALAVLDRLQSRFPSAAALIWRGMAKRAMGHMDEAIADYTKAIELDPKLLEAYDNRGIAKAQMRLFDEAIEDYFQAIKLDPTNAATYSNRGLAKSAKGFFDEVVADYTKAIELDPKLLVAYVNRGTAKAQMGLFDEAIVDFAKAIELDPKCPEAYSNRGAAKHCQGLFDEAMADIEKAIELDPEFASAYSNRGSMKSAKGLLDEAVADCTKAIELDPNYAEAYDVLGIAKFHKGLFDEAIAYHTKAIDLNSRLPSAYTNRGISKHFKGQFDEAIADHTKAIEVDPRFAPAYYNRGVANTEKGLYDKAIADHTKAIGLDPKYAAAFDNRGSAKSGKGLFDEAIVDHTKATTLDPKFVTAYFNRGNAKLNKGLFDEAIADYTKAIDLDPKEARSYTNRGFAKSSKGQYDEAVADWEKALEVAPPGWPHQAALRDRLTNMEATRLFDEANKLHELKKYREAIGKFKSVAESYPKIEAGKNSAYNIACCYALLGEKADALEWLEKAVEMGYKDLDNLVKDSDLASLRGEERYKKLVKSLEAK